MSDIIYPDDAKHKFSVPAGKKPKFQKLVLNMSLWKEDHAFLSEEEWDSIVKSMNVMLKSRGCCMVGGTTLLNREE